MTVRSDAAERGSSFLELLIAIAVVGVSVAILVQQVAISVREAHEDLEAQFGYAKATGILAEIQTDVDQGRIKSGAALDAIVDLEHNPLLTIRDSLTPEHVLSGNTKTEDGAWRWYRRVSTVEVPGADHSRYVTVRIWRLSRSGKHLSVATSAGLINVPVAAEPATKTYDVYLLAIAEAPSLWQPLVGLRAQIQALANEIEGNNPNLRLRLHWITKLGYGRDPLYTPYSNLTQTSDSGAPYAYFYPSKLTPGAGYSTLYAPETMTGRIRTEAGLRNGYDSVSNPLPHSIADRFNHCMRTPAARRLFDARVAAGLEEATSPPLQILLADMAAHPERFRNAMFVNLHGGGLPFPPVRNYSDPARDPALWPGVRVVTHPASLHTIRDMAGPDLQLRTYAYKSDPDAGPAMLNAPITVQIMGGNFANWITVERQAGGIDTRTGAVATGATPFETYAYGPASKAHVSLQPFEMFYEVGYSTTPEPHTWIRLHNTPLVCPPLAGAGIDPDQRLYGLEYIPSPVWTADGFLALSSAAGSDQPKNTVRWRISIAQPALSRVLGNATQVEVRTRIGTDTTTGQAYPALHSPHNLSTTYAWWSANPNDVPPTERYQFLGDPRHNPYIDLGATGPSEWAHGYNWWFDDLRDDEIDERPAWSFLDGDRLRAGFATGVVEDVPRMLQVWRDALQGCGAVFSNPGGMPARCLLLGGELALPGPDLQPRAVPVHGELYGTTGATTACDLLTSSNPALLHGRAVIRSGAFWAMPWIGELVPEDQAAAYGLMGNLATTRADGSPLSHRAVRSRASLTNLPRTTDWSYPSGAMLDDLGTASLLQAGPATATIGPRPELSRDEVDDDDKPGATPNTSLEATLGEELRAYCRAVGITTPPTLPAPSPFILNTELAGTLPQRQSSSTYPDHTLTLVEQFSAGAEGSHGSAALQLTSPLGPAALFVPFSVVPATPLQHRDLAMRGLTFGLRALHAAREPNHQGAGVAIPPRLDLLEPRPQQSIDDPIAVRVSWSSRITRFDERQYTSRIVSEPVDSEVHHVYVVTYRNLAAPESHYYAVDNLPATPGQRPQLLMRQFTDAGPGSELYMMPTPPTQFPAGDYAVRVDAYDGRSFTHAASNEVFFKIYRNAP